MKAVFVVGRSATKTPQPRVMHLVSGEDADIAACGKVLRYSSRTYTSKSLSAIMCRNCERKMEA